MTLHPQDMHPAPGMWDALAELVHAVRVPKRFRRSKPRPERRQPAHTLEWTDDDQAQPLRALLEPALKDTARRSPSYGRPRPVVAARDRVSSGSSGLVGVYAATARDREQPFEMRFAHRNVDGWSLDYTAVIASPERCPLDRMRAIRALEIAVATTQIRPKEHPPHAT